MENFTNLTENKKLEITSKFLSYFKESGGWALFLAILGFVAIGLMILGGLIFGIVMMNSYYGGEIGAIVMLVYVVMGGVMFFPTLYMLKFATGIRAAIKSGNDDDYDNAFKNLKNYFKFVGIMTIVIIGLYIVFILIAIIASVIGSVNF